MTHNYPTMTLDVSHERKEMLRAISEEFGLFIGRGRMHDAGSIQKLIEKIADGELKVISFSAWREAKKMGIIMDNEFSDFEEEISGE